MRPTLKKLEVKDIGDLEKLVAENVEGIEPGLKVIDSRLLLGHAAIDLVGLDEKASLVLIALDFTADEGLLLRVMDAYSWCLEYPDTIRRLYPMAQIASGRPPRILFIVERVTDSFLRRIKQLSFLQIDCLEFRHLEVNGTTALYFDLVQQLRRSEAEAETPAERQTPPLRSLASRAAAPGVTPSAVEPSAAVAPSVSPPLVASPAAVVMPTPVVPTPVAAAPAAAPPALPVAEPARAVVAETPATAPAPLDAVDGERGATLVAVPVESPLAEGGVEGAMTKEPVSEEAAVVSVQVESIEAVTRRNEPVVPMVDVAKNPEWEALLDQLGVAMPDPSSLTMVAGVAPAVTSEAGAAEAPDDIAGLPAVAEPREEPAAIQAAIETPQAAEPRIPTPPAWAKPAEKAVPSNAGRTYFFAQAAKGTTPPEPQAAEPTPVPAGAVEPAPVPATATEPSAADRPELESLNFPKDGLSRQWLEFLNQLSTAK